jgi:hypothetical protein
MHASRTFKRLLVALALVGLALLPHGRALASQPVDPGSLTPPPPPNATCQATGMGTICRSDRQASFVSADTGISCGTFEVLDTDAFNSERTVIYDESGNRVEAVGHISDVGVFLNSVTGQTVSYSEHVTATTTWPNGVGQTRWDGQMDSVTAQGTGLVFHDVGTVTFNGFGDEFDEGGPHDLIDNFPDAVQALCTALSS